ncbi:MAG: hypothetical protein HY903_25335 [Deltaproteobacteria bacterium]|nr:hypothetical protein [Deltaproteobacteria bacterium]
MRALLWDLFLFVEILVYWILVLVLIGPLWLLDRALGTSLHRPLDRLTRCIAGL